MARNIFIGSSSEARGIAEQLARQLLNKRFTPLPWWTAFKMGDVTIDVLSKIADDVDAAVLVWNADDQVWYRGSKSDVTRDNCILEYGLFASKLGRSRTGVLAKRGVRLPSDIAGLTIKFYDDACLDTAIQEIVSEIDAATKPSSPNVVPVYTDESIWRMAVGSQNIPLNWASRSLYIRDEGANFWRRIASNPKYTLYAVGDAFGLSKLLIKALDVLSDDDLNNIHRIVSLGPGDGRFEESLHAHLRSRGTLLEWIPVDISQGLLNFVVYSLQRKLPIDRAIVGDFEEGLNFIFHSIHSRENPTPRLPMLITMLGGTFGNLDTGEHDFMASLKGHMNDGDLFFCDLPVKGTEWTFEAEPRASLSGYDDDSINFLFQGLGARLQKATNEIKQKERLTIIRSDESDIPSTDVISLVDKETEYKASRFRRYDWKETLAWFHGQIGVKIVFAQQTERRDPSTKDVRRMGVLLLRRT